MDGQRVNCEDEITSIVFGSLEFLPVSDCWVFWKALLNSPANQGESGALPRDFFENEFQPESCEFQFWRKFSGIEPDLWIQFIGTNKDERNLLVEIKWDAPLSGENQLERQWEEYSEDRSKSLHVFIAKNLREFPTNKKIWMNDGDKESCRLRGVRWHSLRQEINKISKYYPGMEKLKRWSNLVDGFLGLVGINTFVGFDETKKNTEALSVSPEIVSRFWQGHSWFKKSVSLNDIQTNYVRFWRE